MKNHPLVFRVTLSAATAALLATSVGAFAQVGPPGPPPPPPVAVPDPALVPGGEFAAPFNGAIKHLLINPEGRIDGLLLTDDTVVQFPPHLGESVASALKLGDAVQGVGDRRDPRGVIRARQISAATGGPLIVDQPPPNGMLAMPPSLRGVGLVKLSVQGTVLRMTTGPRGEADGAVLDDGTVVKLAPPAAQQFEALLQPGTRIAADGFGTRNQYGMAMQVIAFGRPGSVAPLYDNVPR